MTVTAATASFADVYTAALQGTPCTVVGLHPDGHPLPVAGWTAAASASDVAVLEHCHGTTLDVGCGPGRMSEHLVARGHLVLGIDIVAEAVAQARRRGVAALQRNVFDALPGEGRWDTALLADGNIGIGGDPATLLRRVRKVLKPAGRIICDLAEPGTGLRTARARLECGPHRSGHFPWALVGPEALVVLAASCGLVVEAVHEVEGRWFGVLSR